MNTPLWLKPFEGLDVYFLKPAGRFLKAEGTGFLLIPVGVILLLFWLHSNRADEDMGLICADIESMMESPAFLPGDIQFTECTGPGRNLSTCRQMIAQKSPAAENLLKDAYHIHGICSNSAYPLF